MKKGQCLRYLGFDLPEGTTPERAQEIIKFLNDNIRFITYTGADRPEWSDNPGRGAMAWEKRKPRLATTDGAPVDERPEAGKDAGGDDAA